MFSFYAKLLSGALAYTWNAADLVWVVIVSLGTILASYKHAWLSTKIGALSWVSIAIPIFLLLLYRVMRENYLVISDLKQAAENIPTPDVMFEWGFTHLNKSGVGMIESDKDILVHNRSHEWIYNVLVSPIKLEETLTFGKINRIPPADYVAATPNWDRFPDQTKKMVTDFLCRDMNTEKAKELGIYRSKDKGISEFTMNIPVEATFMHGTKTWKLSAIFNYDPGFGALCSFEKVSITPNVSARYKRYWETQSV